MERDNLNKVFSAKLSDSEFSRLSRFITEHAGIKLPEAKKVMLQSRLQKRLRHHGMTSYKDYIEYVFSETGLQNEIIHMLDVVSTNKTDFFREPVHFEFMEKTVLPEYVDNYPLHRTMKIWSAGCSSGEEVYTIAMTIEEFKEQYPELTYSILGTDISTDILQKALNAVYKEEKVETVPLQLKKKYLLRSKDRTKRKVKIVQDLRRKAHFRRLNFMDTSYDISEIFDVIFCRNVLIYFNRDTQEKVIQRLCRKLKTGGYFFIGHSESIMGMDVPLKQIRPTIFMRT
ncbi:MAG: CheR family methyltransferase [Bacteroidales bacterium]